MIWNIKIIIKTKMKFIFTYYSNISFTEIENFSVLLCTLPVIIYSNPETDKLKIINDNKGKSGIYLWTHKESGKMYIGSAVDLSKRFLSYYSPLYLKRANNYICNALTLHSHSAFSLSIVEYIDLKNLSLEEARNLILEREQYYLDSLLPKYNILKVAGSLLGYKHTQESLIKISEANKGISRNKGINHSNFGKNTSDETRAKMSLANKGISRNKGIPKSPETKALMSLANKGKSPANKGLSPSTVTRIKLSASKGTAIFVYDLNDLFVISFTSAKEAAKHFGSNHSTILKYASSGKTFKTQWILSLSAK
jgi:group I intron endonuclease